jgi:hypothetical protein
VSTEYVEQTDIGVGHLDTHTHIHTHYSSVKKKTVR